MKLWLHLAAHTYIAAAAPVQILFLLASSSCM
jgi:hypothetical protein